MPKYPGTKILYEVGTRLELAKLYGVSERTIYRWLNKAAEDSGLTMRTKKKTPKASTLSKFKGTRKQLAQKYGVSERTVYRWLNKARTDGVEIPRRENRSKYPGAEILATGESNKSLAKKYNVSTRTISRWKSKARIDALYSDIISTPSNIPEEPLSDFGIPDEESPSDIMEIPEPDLPEAPLPIDEEIPEEFTDYADYDISTDMFDNLKTIYQSIEENELSDSEIYKNLTYKEKILYINNYLMYQYDQDPSQFYDPVTHKFRFDTDWVTQYIDIWGAEFDEWVDRQFESDMYEI